VGNYTADLPEGVDVETATFIAYGDGRPTEVVLAGTTDDQISHRVLTPQGESALSVLLAQTLLLSEVVKCDE
jgi:hypothetical protein